MINIATSVLGRLSLEMCQLCGRGSAFAAIVAEASACSPVRDVESLTPSLGWRRGIRRSAPGKPWGGHQPLSFGCPSGKGAR